MPQAKNHIHKYKRAKYKNGTPYYFCATPDCNHRSDPELTFGKLSICWRCGEPFEMNPRSYRQDKPHCELCVVSRQSKKRKRDEPSIVDQLGIKIPDAPGQSIKFADSRQTVFGRRTEDKAAAKVIGENIVTSLKERLAALSGGIEVQAESSDITAPISSLEESIEVEIDDNDEDPEL